MSRRFSVRRSPIHGRGVFALADITAGDVIAPFRGELIDAATAAHRASGTSTSEHTFLFALSDGRVIDGGTGGNSVRWLNHSCDPNCEAWEYEDAIVIVALRDIAESEELVIDYQLQADGQGAEGFACSCSSASCRGVMLAS